MKETISRERRAFLKAELRAYERKTEMTDEERQELRAWVAEGNSVYENPSMVCSEGGAQSDFLSVYRHEEEIRRELSKLDEADQMIYIARLHGEPTASAMLGENLREALLKADVYRRILQSHGLLDEAELELGREMERRSRIPAPVVGSDGEEMPFQ